MNLMLCGDFLCTNNRIKVSQEVDRIEYVYQLLCHTFVFIQARVGNNKSLLLADTVGKHRHVCVGIFVHAL